MWSIQFTTDIHSKSIFKNVIRISRVTPAALTSYFLTSWWSETTWAYCNVHFKGCIIFRRNFLNRVTVTNSMFYRPGKHNFDSLNITPTDIPTITRWQTGICTWIQPHLHSPCGCSNRFLYQACVGPAGSRNVWGLILFLAILYQPSSRSLLAMCQDAGHHSLVTRFFKTFFCQLSDWLEG